MVYWTESVDIKDPGFCADLVFKSINNATVVFTDDFDPNVLNFTGSHRLLFKAKKHSRIAPKPGMLVVSTGKYMNLDNEPVCTIDEALPIVKLSNKEKDKRVFGVLNTVESDTKHFKTGLNSRGRQEIL